MSKTYMFIALLSTFTHAFAAYSTYNYSVFPTSVAADTDTNFTTASSLILTSIATGNIHLVAQTVTLNSDNIYANKWSVWLRKLDTATLRSSDNSMYSFNAPIDIFYLNNHAVAITSDNNTGIPQIRVYQQQLTGGLPLPKLALSTNINPYFTPVVLGIGVISNTIYVFHLASFEKANVGGFTVGSAVRMKEFTLSKSYNNTAYSLSVAYGAALGTNHLLASWIEQGVLKYAVVDVRTASADPIVVTGFTNSLKCSAFATDKMWYGQLCTSVNTTTGIMNYYIRTNTTSLILLVSYPYNTSELNFTASHGPYLIFVTKDTISVAPNVTYSYEMWNLDNLTQFKKKTPFLTMDSNSSVYFYKVPSGGVYTLLYNNRQQADGTLSAISVGMLIAPYVYALRLVGWSSVLWSIVSLIYMVFL